MPTIAPGIEACEPVGSIAASSRWTRPASISRVPSAVDGVDDDSDRVVPSPHAEAESSSATAAAATNPRRRCVILAVDATMYRDPVVEVYAEPEATLPRAARTRSETTRPVLRSPRKLHRIRRQYSLWRSTGRKIVETGMTPQEDLMMHHNDPLAHAQRTAQEWLKVVGEQLGTEDRNYTYRVLRAWLHLVRDRPTVDGAVHLAAQLPEFLRGIYFEGWVPSKAPVRYDAAGFTRLFADATGISPADVPATAGAVFAGLGALFSPGQLDHVLAQMPTDLRNELAGQTPARVAAPRDSAEHRRLQALEDRVQALTEAVSALAHGFEELPTEGPTGSRAARAAQEAHRILMVAGTVG